MIQFLRTWANQIIASIIIATILEMLLPNGNNKKYIKMVIGLYVLFAIIQPVFSKLTGDSIAIENFNYQKYFKESSIETSSSDFEQNNTKLIQQAYIENVKSDIKTKLEKKGYIVTNCVIQMNEKEGESYGCIEQIDLTIQKQGQSVEKEEKNNSSIQIKKVEIMAQNNTIQEKPQEEKSTLSDKEKQEIMEYLSNEYSVAKTDIVVH